MRLRHLLAGAVLPLVLCASLWLVLPLGSEATTPQGRAASLQKKIETALQRIGLPPESRKFSAHVTLARMKGAPREKVVQFLTHHALFASGPFPVDHFVLFSSLLSHSGSIYHLERVYPLTSFP